MFFILIIPFAVISTYTYFYIEFNSKKEFKSTMTRFTTNASKANIETPLNEIKLIFRTLSYNIDEVDIKKYINNEKTDLNTVIPAITDSTVFFSNVIISDANDNYKIYPSLNIDKFSPRERPWYPLTATKDTIIYSEPYLSILNDINGTSKSKKKSITASENLYNKHSEFIGNIAFDLDLKSISSTINNKLPPYNGKFLITSSTGEVVLSENKLDIFKKNVPQYWIERASAVEGDFYDSHEGVFVFYKTYMNPDWIAFTVVNESDYHDITNIAKKTFWIVVLSCFVFYIIMIILLKLYLEQIISKLYMVINGLDHKKDRITIGSIYENIQKSKQNLDRALYESMVDSLTNIFNRRKFDIDTNKFISNNHSFYLAMIDIDDFKKINDTYGHDTGDIVLKTVSKMGQQIMGDTHAIYRFGGEELCVIYVGDDYPHFYELIDTWLKMVAIREWREPDLHVTFSAGIEKYKNEKSIENVLINADKKLYIAKSKGKNRIIGM